MVTRSFLPPCSIGCFLYNLPISRKSDWQNSCQAEVKYLDRFIKRIMDWKILLEQGGRKNENGETIALDLSECCLDTLPSEIWQLTSLTTLNLRENGLRTLPAGIGRLTGLTELNVSRNLLRTLPAEISKLTALEKLSGWGNLLLDLPAEIGQLTSLTELNIAVQYSHRPMSTLPPIIPSCAIYGAAPGAAESARRRWKQLARFRRECQGKCRREQESLIQLLDLDAEIDAIQMTRRMSRIQSTN